MRRIPGLLSLFCALAVAIIGVYSAIPCMTDSQRLANWGFWALAVLACALVAVAFFVGIRAIRFPSAQKAEVSAWTAAIFLVPGIRFIVIERIHSESWRLALSIASAIIIWGSLCLIIRKIKNEERA